MPSRSKYEETGSVIRAAMQFRESESGVDWGQQRHLDNIKHTSPQYQAGK